MRSMTAYASRMGSDAGTTWMWEMRGVNARGLDLRLRLPDGLDGFEATLRTALKKALHRGNISLTLKLGRDDIAEQLALDTAQLDRVLDALDQVQERAFSMGVTLGQPTAADVLTQRGVIVQGNGFEISDGLVAALTADIAPLLDDFTAMRVGEGAALAKVISAQLETTGTLIALASDAAEARKPEMAATLRENMTKVLRDVAEVDDARLAQELALLAVKQDVTEELDRLRAHVAAAQAMVADLRPMGRKLDFLAQEFNREANTLCSKAQNAGLTAIGLDLKAVIDQMREQIQNVE